MYALNGSQATGPDSLTKLLALLKTSKESNVRVAVLRLLIKVLPKPAIEVHMRTLVDILKDEASDMKDVAIDALEAFRPEAMGPVIELLLPLLDSTNGSVRGVALQALSRLLITAMPQLSVSVRQTLLLRLLLCVENDVTGDTALQVFQSVMPKLLTKEDLRVLVRKVEPLLMHESKNVCDRAGRLVINMGRWAIKQVATLPLAKLAEQNTARWQEGHQSFFDIIIAGGAPTVQAHALLLVKLCTHEGFNMRMMAIKALAQGSSPRQHASLFVEKLSRDVDEEVRRDALLALQQVGTAALSHCVRA